MSIWLHFIGDNAFQIEASTEEKSIRSKYPLLLHSNEHVELAFKGRGGVGRDKSYLTSHRILIKDGKGIGSKRKNYLSIPYASIQAFAVETAGKFDGDVDLKVWSTGKQYQSIHFAAGQIDIFAIQQYLNSKVNWTTRAEAAGILQEEEDYVHGTPCHTGKSGTFSSLMDWVGDNAKQLQPQEVDIRLKTETPVLLQDEKVDLAFKAGRDSVVFSDKRLMVVDVQGILGQKIQFISFPWRSISGFSVETAGAYFDRDTDMKLYTNILGYGMLRQDFRKSKADLFAIQKYLSNKILEGHDDDTSIVPGVDRKQGHVDPKTSWWFRENQRPLDAVEMDKYYHESIPILQKSEKVELAFKGRRDITLFTTKRLIDIDPQGMKGVKIEYTSIPWKSVVGFGVKTAGKHFDTDCEAIFWTDMMTFTDGDGNATPGMAYVEVDFNKNLVDILAIQKYLSAKLLGKAQDVPVPQNVFMTSSKETGFEKFLSKIGDDQRAIDPRELNTALHSEQPILLDEEHIIMAFKAGRDVTLFTNVRIMILDVQGWSGEKIQYTSIPYASIRAFSAESAGKWDRDSEVDIYTRNQWSLCKCALDFRKGKADIVAIQKFLSAIVLGNNDEAGKYLNSTESTLPTTNAAGLQSFLAWIEQNSSQENAEVTNQQLHSNPPILLDDEKVIRSYKSGRDMFVYTNQRLLKVDVQGLTGTKIEYKSIPYEWCTGFEIETAGNFDRDAELYLHTDIPGKKTTKHSILVKAHDIYELQEFIYGLLLFRDENTSSGEK